jgi:hypothetical protein
MYGWVWIEFNTKFIFWLNSLKNIDEELYEIFNNSKKYNDKYEILLTKKDVKKIIFLYRKCNLISKL